jgi:hypothetical protein
MTQQTMAIDAKLQQQLGQMATGYWVTQALRVVTMLNVADLLKDGAKTSAQLATETKANASALHRVLRALASVGVFKEDADGRFSLTALGQLLRADHPQTQKYFILMISGAPYQAWGKLDFAVKTGNSSFNEAFGMPIFEYLGKHPEEHKIFDAAMTGIHGPETEPMIEAYDFSVFKTVADIGGGNGLTISGIINRYSNVSGILFDMPQVVERAKGHVSNKIRIEGGDFFKTVPSADAYVLRHIIHDWSDEQAASILKNCRKAMTKGGKILIVESVIPEGNDPCFGKWLDLMMLVIGGKERTETQYRDLLKDAGLKLNRIIPTAAEISIVEAVAT